MTDPIDQETVLNYVQSKSYQRLTGNQRVAALRMYLDLTQKQLGDTMGYNWVVVSRVERGERRMTPAFQFLLAVALGVRVADLFAPHQIARELASPRAGKPRKLNPTSLPEHEPLSDEDVAEGYALELDPVPDLPTKRRVMRPATIKMHNQLKRRVDSLEEAVRVLRTSPDPQIFRNQSLDSNS